MAAASPPFRSLPTERTAVRPAGTARFSRVWRLTIGMDAATIDHVNLRITADGTEAAIDFYRDCLGFVIEGLEQYEADEQSFFDVRLAPEHVLHLRPTDEFEPPSGNGFNHVALLIKDDIAAIKRSLDESDVTIANELDSPLGATGRAPAVYVEDPFGYRIELKTTANE